MKKNILFFICITIHLGESIPREGYIWPNATLWPNATNQHSNRNHVPVADGSTQRDITNIDINQGYNSQISKLAA